MSKTTNYDELHWVYQSMINWRAFSDDREGLQQLLSRSGTTFYFLRGEMDMDDVHAYLGVFNNKIYLHFIPSSFDREEYFINTQELPCQLYSYQATEEILLGGWIETDDALNRIEQWKNEELRNKALDANMLHRAFFMPNDNFKANIPLKINFALNNNVADLVIEQEGIEYGFYDTCRPVPPFPPSTQEENFSLLRIIDQWM